MFRYAAREKKSGMGKRLRDFIDTGPVDISIYQVF